MIWIVDLLLVHDYLDSSSSLNYICSYELGQRVIRQLLTRPMSLWRHENAERHGRVGGGCRHFFPSEHWGHLHTLFSSRPLFLRERLNRQGGLRLFSSCLQCCVLVFFYFCSTSLCLPLGLQAFRAFLKAFLTFWRWCPGFFLFG